MYKHSLLHGPGTFFIRSCKFNSHLHHGPQATSTKAKRKKRWKGVTLGFKSQNSHYWAKIEIFFNVQNSLVAWWSLMEHQSWRVEGLQCDEDTRFMAVMSSVWPWESQLNPLSLASSLENSENKSSCFAGFREESFKQDRPQITMSFEA